MLKSEKCKASDDTVDVDGRDKRRKSQISKGKLMIAKTLRFASKGSMRRLSGISG